MTYDQITRYGIYIYYIYTLSYYYDMALLCSVYLIKHYCLLTYKDETFKLMKQLSTKFANLLLLLNIPF